MPSETKELMKSDVIRDFAMSLRGEIIQNGSISVAYEPVLETKHISTIISLLEMYVNDVVRSSNMDNKDALQTCASLHQDMADWFFLNWDTVDPVRMTRDQIINAMTNLIFATWKCADHGSFRKDLFGHALEQLQVRNTPFR